MINAKKTPQKNKKPKWHIKNILGIQKLTELSKTINHESVLKDVAKEGFFCWRVAIFVTIASAIATLGLLTNSPAVIIGAMLISPLMGSIACLGFSLAVLDEKLIKASCICIVRSSILGIFISFIIVFCSPIYEVTPEIVSRTNPNLFDLLVAVLSAIAAGYCFINQQGASMVGIAIATALMPPLAVVGFGLATGDFQIAKGSFLLFTTNLLAICIMIFFMARIYGFKQPGEQSIRTAHLIFGYSILLLLAYPLSVSLKNIAYQTYATKVSKNTIESYFSQEPHVINSFSISFETNKLIITAIISTKYYRPKAKNEILKKIKKLLGKEIDLDLMQIALAKKKIPLAFPAVPIPTPLKKEAPKE